MSGDPEVRCPKCGEWLIPHYCGAQVVTVATTVCPACMGDGKVFRMTDSYAAMVAQASGRPFGWTGQTHEWRTCHACGGSGLL